MDKSSRAPILVLLQQRGEGLHPLSQELCVVAGTLAADGSQPTVGVLLTQPSGGHAELEKQLLATGLEAVYWYKDAAFASFIPEAQLPPLLGLIKNLRPGVLLASATPEGRALAPMLGAKLATGVTADCTALSLQPDGLLVQTRPAFGGDVMADIYTANTLPQIATVRYGAGDVQRTRSVAHITKLFRQVPPATGAPRTQVRCETPAPQDAGADSGIVLAIGGGLRAKEDIALFERLATKLDARLMCSRRLVERGWCSGAMQVGLSGQSIQARLLLTMGISGSVQFLTGIQGCEHVCAINSDRHAPILLAADIPLLGDIYEVATLLLEGQGTH